MIRLLAALLAVALQAGPVGAADPADQNCPLRARSCTAGLVQAHLAGAVGKQVILSFTLDPPQPPQGFFLSVNMNALQAPEPAKRYEPEILTGFPETSAVFRAPGTYRYAVVVSLISKSSCGGVKAGTVFTGEVLIDVQP